MSSQKKKKTAGTPKEGDIKKTYEHPLTWRKFVSLELFSGFGNVSRQFDEAGWETYFVASTEVNLLQNKFADIGKVLDFVWVSLPDAVDRKKIRVSDFHAISTDIWLTIAF
jgi:hypothetical protein